MGLFKTYLTPRKSAKAASEATNPIDMVEQPRGSVFPPTGGTGLTPWSSRPASLHSTKTMSDDLSAIQCEVMCTWLFETQRRRLWYGGHEDEGVVLKKSPGVYTSFPPQLADVPHGFMKAIETLNVRCAMTVNTRVLQLFLSHNTFHFVPLNNGLRIQVLPDVSYLPTCQKHHFAAFIADRCILVVWDDQPENLVHRVTELENSLMSKIWQERVEQHYDDDKKTMTTSVYGVDESVTDVEQQAQTGEATRRIVLIQPFLTALTLCMALAAIGAGWRKVAIELAVDKTWTRLAFAAVVPLQLWVSLFFFQSVATNVAQLLGPVKQLLENSKFYSGQPPRRLQIDTSGQLPHLTIQCPVYKEGLHAVIEPTVRSIKAAISTYEMQGGTANIFINDDGMQLLSEDEARQRQDFYDEHNIGWVARPKHDPKGTSGTPFVRRGKFKKASNMNYALWVSNRVEDKLAILPRTANWSQADEAMAYQDALLEVIDEDKGDTWADGNIRVGDYVLLIDSDTRVPRDCLLDAVSEMEESPQVAILQYSSGVMNITTSFFERGITFFTNLIYTQIKYAVANGDVAPFVGHNAILRWSAVQHISYECQEDGGREKYWAENTVSEDFDMALRLQSEGFVLRLGGYTGDGFKEGVSLTVYDELARWEKYAYGCSELLFHPIRYWPTRGPFTPLFRRFIASGIPLPSKFTIMAYIGTYYALASAWSLTLLNYFMIGWYLPKIDKYYLDSFGIWLSIIVVFSCVGNISLAVLRYRSGESSLFRSVFENFSWLPLLLIFLGGVSLHVSQAILSHLFSVDMSWGATAKEVENTTFFEELPKLMRKFKYTFLYCILCTGMMVALARAMPYFWTIDLFVAIFPLSINIFCHFMLPVVLNPSLMLFTW